MSTDSRERRQEVYNKIKASGSKTKYIYSEMRRLGFWKDDGTYDFKVIEEYFSKEQELVKQLNELLVKKRQVDKPDELLKAIHTRRKKEAKAKREETKARREEERIQKAEKWAKRKNEGILYLGAGYSNTLDQATSDEGRLTAAGLPIMHAAADLAAQMHVSLGRLRFLAFDRRHSKTTHYQRFSIAKRNGGERTISAPMPYLKSAQHWILFHVLEKVEVHPAAHGCVKGQSILTNAAQHLGKELLINQDLSDFFPTITYARVRGLFKGMGYSAQLASIFALICTEAELMEIDVHGERYYSRVGERHLPQGSPCSPAITNILCRRMDARLDGLAKKFGYSYSRYVDDISFSASGGAKEDINKVLLYSRKVIEEEGFALNKKKLQVMRKGNQQRVTGILVNEKPNVDKKTFKKFRAVVYQIEKDGIEGKHWNGRTGQKLLSSLHGYATFVHQVNPELGASYKARVQAILDKEDYRPENPWRREEMEKEGYTTKKEGSAVGRFFKKLFGG